MKTCSVCLIEKTLDQFRKHRTPCKSCLYKKEKETRVRDFRKVKDHKLKTAFGIGIEQYEEMLKSQNGVCAICGLTDVGIHHMSGKPRMLAVDHDHVTGKVRALLCNECNQGLGKFKDNPELLEQAAMYLRKYV